MADESVIDPAQGFAGMMDKAASLATPGAGETPERAPRATQPRRRKSPSVEELKQKAQEAPPADPPSGDRPPEKQKRAHRRVFDKDSPQARKPVPQFREGQIAGGMNRLYRRAGKMVKVFDPVVGQAFIEATRKEDDTDITVGEAWEELARQNPRVRAFLLKMISGGAMGQLVMAHAPILLAIMMKDGVRNRLPMGNLMAAYLDGGSTDGEAPAAGTPMEGLRPEDMAQMQAAAEQMAQQFMARGAPGATPRAPQTASEPPPVQPRTPPAGNPGA